MLRVGQTSRLGVDLCWGFSPDMRSWQALISSSRVLTRCGPSARPKACATFHVRSSAHEPRGQLPQISRAANRSIPSNVLEHRRNFWGTKNLEDRNGEPRSKETRPSASAGQPDAQQEATTGLKSDISSSSQPIHSIPRSSPERDNIQSQNTEISDPPLPLPNPSPDPPSSEAELPSESLSRRNNLTLRLQTLTDRLITSLSLASHRVNTLTGTDYSAIAALRESIAQQGRDVRDGHKALSKARTAHDTAVATQAASQKEVVQLLERKHSWSAADLERYMSLIRSEHTDEQTVTAAREELERCEARLETARQQVERAERKQYHEEQIWSDTIRRNSTWVTFGLMGLNILLLIVNLVMIEPWRRKRMVKEIRMALDEKSFAASSSGAIPVTTTDRSEMSDEAIDAAAAELNTQGTTTVVTKDATAPADAYLADTDSGFAATAGSDSVSEQADIGEEAQPRRFRDRILGSVNSWFWSSWNWANFLLSEEDHVILSRVDFTTALAESWAVGATCMLLLFVTLPIDLSDVFK